VLKTATGSGTMPVERKYADAGQAPVTAGLFFQANQMPRMPALDRGLMRRLYLYTDLAPIEKGEQRAGEALRIFGMVSLAIQFCV
jgi:phage/plasmid-associated DNA primase